ncbi:putative Zn-dependent peptidase [Anaerotaenia torta]|uniref:M16 family metallopeptidase n=1 Tax=Anaerotaenia torta TaxID=433293 RepID=UPI003D245049
MTNIHQLSNRITVVTEVLPYLKSAAFGVWIKAGSANEEESNNGIAHMIEHMLFKGTRSRNAKQIADEMARIGGNMNAFTSKECTCYYAATLSEHLPIAIDILADMLTNSLIDEKALKKEKGVIIEEIDMYDDSPEDLVHELLQQRIWKDHPLGYMISGTKKVVRRVTREQILDFMEQYYVGENIIISVAGSFEEASVLELLKDKFGGIQAASGAEKKEEEVPEYHRVRCKRHKDIEQLHYNIAFPCISYLSEERYELSVLNSILGGSVSSRLFQRIRENSGLTYSIYSYGSSYRKTGLFHIYAAMNPSQAPAVAKKIQQIIADIRKKGVTSQELSMTKEQLKTELILGNESAKSRMNANGKSMLNHGRLIPIEELIVGVNQVSLEGVKEFASRYLDMEQTSVSLVGNLQDGSKLSELL